MGRLGLPCLYGKRGVMQLTGTAQVAKARAVTRPKGWRLRRSLPLYLMLLPALVCLVLFNYMPMAGLVMAFQNFKPLLGFFQSPFVGLGNFEKLFALNDFWLLIRNTLFIAAGKMILAQLASLTLALRLHEVTNFFFKRTVQTITYALYFLSWIIFGAILLDMLGSDG